MRRFELRPGTIFQYPDNGEPFYVPPYDSRCNFPSKGLQASNHPTWDKPVEVLWAPPVDMRPSLPEATEKAQHQLSFPEKWCDPGLPATNTLTGLADWIPRTEDVVNNPSHYTSGSIETIDFIEAKELGYCLGNAVKYISRSGKKDPAKAAEDIQKAVWYLNRYLESLK